MGATPMTKDQVNMNKTAVDTNSTYSMLARQGQFIQAHQGAFDVESH